MFEETITKDWFGELKKFLPKRDYADVYGFDQWARIEADDSVGLRFSYVSNYVVVIESETGICR